MQLNAILVNRLINRKSCDLAGSILLELYIPEFHALDSLVRRHARVKSLYLILKIFLHISDSLVGKQIRIRVNLSNDCDLVLLDAAFTCIDYDLIHTFHLLEISLNLLRIDILAVRKNDQVLLAASDIDPSSSSLP